MLRWACLMHLELISVSCRYRDRISGNEQDSLQGAACKTIRLFTRHVQGSCLTSGFLPASSSSSALGSLIFFIVGSNFSCMTLLKA